MTPRIVLASLVLLAVIANLAAHPIAVTDRLDFGPVRVGEAVDDTVRLTNLGPDDLLITSADVPPPVFILPGTPFSDDLLLLSLIHI